MCAVSMIYDHYYEWQQTAPRPIPWPTAVPASLPWDRDTFDAVKDVIKRLDEIDKKLGLANCEDPKKAEWMQAIEERLKALEQKVEV